MLVCRGVPVYVCVPIYTLLEKLSGREGQCSAVITLSVVIRASVALLHGHLDRVLNVSPFKVFLLTVKQGLWITGNKQAFAQMMEQTECHCHDLKLGVYLIL